MNDLPNVRASIDNRSVLGGLRGKLGGRSRSKSHRDKLKSFHKRKLRLETLERRHLLAATLGGWAGSYHNSLPDATADLVRHDAMIDFDWGQLSALDQVSPSDGFSAVWEGNLRSDHTATHELIVRTELGDGVRVWVNEQVVIDAWAGAGADELRASVPLIDNQLAATKVEYRDVSGNARIWLGWTSPELPTEVVGPEWTPLSSVQVQSLDDVASTGVLFEQVHTIPADFLATGNVAVDAVASGVRLSSTTASSATTTHPGQRMRGFLVPETSGNYQFRISGGSASRLLLADDATPELAREIASLDTPTAAGEWTGIPSQTSGNVTLVAGLQYYIEARQTDSDSYDGLQIQWRTDGGTWSAIPGEQLRPFEAEVGVRAIVSSVNETDDDNVLSFDVYRSDDFGRDLPVVLDFGGTTTRGVDYTGASSTVTIPAGQRSTRVTLTVVSDGIDEVRETIKVSVVPSADYRLETPIRTRTTLAIFGNLAPTGSSLIGDQPALVANIDQVEGTTLANFSNRTATNENGGTVNGTVLGITSTADPAGAATVAARWDVSDDILEGETVYAEFYYRRVGGASWNPFSFELQSKTSSDAWGQTALTATGFWQRTQIPITPGDALTAGSIRAELRLDVRDVTVEIANFQVTRFVKSLADATAVLPSDAVLLSNIDQRSGDGSFATFTNRTTVASEQVPFTNVLRTDVHSIGSFVTSVAARWNSDVVIHPNSLVTASVWLRSDNAPFDVRIEIEQDGVASDLLRNDLQVTNEWTKHEFNLQTVTGSEIGEIELALSFGRSLGRLEVGDVQIFDRGPLPDLTEFLPQSYDTYAERDADSDWRIAAQQKVLDNRRNELVVNVTDQFGAAVAGATVVINQQEHEYRFGNIMRTEYIAENLSSSSTDESLRHQAIASRLFNSITIANGIRWVPWVQSELTGRNSVDWVNENVRDLHGHHLTWGQFALIPDSVEAEYYRLQSDVSQAAASSYLRQAQLDHVAEISAALGGTIEGTDRPKITSWDVANHPVLLQQLWNAIRQSNPSEPLAGPIGEVFDVAAANAHPDTILMVNEGQTIEAVNNPKRAEYFDLITALLAAEKPVEGIGFMNHFNFNEASSPTQLKTYLDQFATLGLPLVITEFDIDSEGTDFQTQADWSEDYFMNVFSNPATEGIISYGFWDQAHWRSDVGAAWYDADWEAKPNADVFVDQIRREWQTQAVGSTRSDGTYRTMAFNGTHGVTVDVDGQSYTATATVNDSGGTVNVVVDANTDGLDVSGVWLVNADTDADIVALTDGAVINLADLTTENLNVRATTDEPVGSVGFELTGATTHSQGETIAPYALFGDASGDFNEGTFATGQHTLVVTAYSGGGLSGTAGTPHTISFEVVGRSLADETVIAPVDAELQSVDGSYLDYGTNGSHWYDGSGLTDATIVETGDAVPMTWPEHVAGNNSTRVSRIRNAPEVNTLTFDLGGTFDVSGMVLWNSTEIGGAGLQTDRGFENTVLSYSTDGGNTFTGSDTLTWTERSADASVNQGDNPTPPVAMFGPEVQSLPSTIAGVTHIRMDVDNFSTAGADKIVMASEIRFVGESTVLPAVADLSVTTANGLYDLTQGKEAGTTAIEFAVTLSEDNLTGAPITFDLEDLGTGTATSGVDYSAIPAGAQISVPTGSNRGTLSVDVVDDFLIEPTELVNVRISNPSHPSVAIGNADAVATIADNDTAGVTVTGANDLAISEAGATDTYTIALDTIPIGTVQITATADVQTEISIDGINFASTQVLSLTDMTPQTVTVRAVDDQAAEETHNATITHAITGTIVDPNYPDVTPDDLYTVNGTDRTFQELLDDGALRPGIDWAGGVQGSEVDVNNAVLEQGIPSNVSIPQDIKAHSLNASVIGRNNFDNITRWYQEDGKTQVFRLFEGEENVRNDRQYAARIETFANAGTAVWNDFSARYTVLKAESVSLFQNKQNSDAAWGLHIGMTAEGDIHYTHRRNYDGGSTRFTLAEDMIGKSFEVLVRDNGHDYELYFNGELITKSYWERPGRDFAWRWGPYRGARPMDHDVLVFVNNLQMQANTSAPVGLVPYRLATTSLSIASATATITDNDMIQDSPFVIAPVAAGLQSDGGSYLDYGTSGDNWYNGSGLSDATIVETGDPVPAVWPEHVAGNNQTRVSRIRSAPEVNTLTFDLGGTFDVSGMVLWNSTEEAASGTLQTDRGFENTVLSYSTDGGITFTGSDTLTWTERTADASVNQGDNPAPPVATFGPEVLTLPSTAADVTHIRMDVDNFSDAGADNIVMASEIRFIGQPQPTSPTVDGLWLVNADDDSDIISLTDGMVIDLATLPTANLNIRATTDVPSGSVGFEVTGATTRSQSENNAPYALFGDMAGDFSAGAFAVGQHTLVVTPYTDADLTGTAGTAMTVNFVVSDGNINSPPTGSVAISGTMTEGQTLTAANTLADADGLGTISYQWQRDGIDIPGAFGSTYTLDDSDVNATITVVASYVDGHGTPESVTSAGIGPISNVNDDPTGSVAISGTPTEDQTLTASNTLDDDDGLGAISYQWQRDGVDISGATASTYTLDDADVGMTISVVASYTDGQGTAESVSSSDMGPVANVNDTPVGVPTLSGTPQENQSLTSGSGGISDADGLGALSYQWLRDAVAISAATDSSYTLTGADVGKRISVAVNYTDAHGTFEGPLTSAETALIEPAPATWTELGFEDFEGGFGSYTDGGGDAILYTGGSLSHQGSNSANLQDNSGVGSSITLTTPLDLATPGYTKLKIEFWFQAVSFERGEDFWLQYSDGSSWQTIATWTRNVDFQNNQFNFASVELSEQNASFTNNAKIRFMADASGNRDDVYLDEIRIEGYGDPPSNLPPVSADDSVTTTQDVPVVVSVLANDSDPNGDMLQIDSFSQGSNGIVSNNGDGTLTYSPSPGFTGGDSFSYTISDGNSGTSTATVNVGVIGPSSWIDLAFEDFENGFGTYIDGGADALLYTGGTRAHQGNNAINLQDNSGIASSIELTNGLDLASPGYTTLKIDFWFQAVSFESGEDFWLQYFDGSSWQTIRTWTVGADFQNGQFYNAAVEISAQDYVFAANAKIRLMSDASGNGDDVYIDEIRISAR